MRSQTVQTWSFLVLLALQLASLTTTTPLLKHAVEQLDYVGALNKAYRPRRQNTNESVASTYAITGLTQFGVQPRLEIRDLEQNADQWNIYLLGLQMMMQANESDLLSHYSVAGVHGRPYVPWNGVQPAPGVSEPGYCMHTSQNFLPWHRPYMLLYEQVLHQYIVEVVNSFPRGSQRLRYAEAAISWRLPYWDWAMDPPKGQPTFPTSISSPTVTVTLPNGTAVIQNPLYQYRFHPSAPVDVFYWYPWNVWNTSIRAPNHLTPDAVSQDNVVNSVLASEQVALKDRLYALFTNYKNYTQFSNQAYENHDAQHSDSMEKLHNVIHDKVGSGGTMTYLEFSAHDPIFFLHHAFVDRCFALWQTLYPDSYVERQQAVEGSYTVQAGWWQDADSPLYPFSADTSGTWFTANSSRDWTKWGYTYPEFLGNYSDSTVRAAINSLYGDSAGSDGLFKRNMETSSAGIRPMDVPGWYKEGKRREYTVNIVSDKMAINGSYAVYVFIGDFDAQDPSCWPTAENLVGADSVFSGFQSQATAENDRTPVLVSGSIPLTSMLLAKFNSAELCSMDPEEVEGYLMENLQWRVAKSDGTEVPLESLSELEVSVVANDVTPACANNEFPIWGDLTMLEHITRGKPGGCA